MSTDFTYGGKQIVSGGPFKPNGKDMPSDARERVDCYADIANIPNPYVGLKITVKVDETNNNKMTDYIVKSLKADSIGMANMLIDEVVRYVDYLEVSAGGGSGEGLTSEQLSNIAKIPAIQSTVDALPNNYASKNHNHSEYASSSHRHDASEIDNLPSGGGTGLTTEQANNIAKIPNIENSLKSIDAVSLNGKKFSEVMTKQEHDAIPDKDPNTIYLIDDTVEDIPSYGSAEANKILAVNNSGTALTWVDKPTGSGTGLTTQQAQQLNDAYQHSLTPHVSNDDINTSINNELQNYIPIIKSPDGKKWKLVVSNGGILSVEQVNAGVISFTNYAYNTDTYAAPTTISLPFSSNLYYQTTGYTKSVSGGVMTLSVNNEIGNCLFKHRFGTTEADTNVYYYRIKFKTNVSNLYVTMPDLTITNANISKNEWNLISNVFSKSSYNDRVFSAVLQEGANRGETIEVKEIMLINLTEVYGSGNEPNKSVCDSTFTEYKSGLEG